jgi:hypothetical protein
MKQVYSYQEIGTLIDQGKQVVFTCHPEARVSAVVESLTTAEARGEDDRLPLFPSGEEAGVEVWNVFEVRACY